MTHTHTYAELEVSAATFDEIHDKLQQAGYEHAFVEDVGRVVIDMHGIGLVRGAATAARALKSIAVMLGWGNVPPQDVLEREIALLKRDAEQGRAVARVANAHGWNGVENSKILSSFIAQELQQLARRREGETTETDAIKHMVAHWFVQGGEAQYGRLRFDGREPENADELVSALLAVLRA